MNELIEIKPVYEGSLPKKQTTEEEMEPIIIYAENGSDFQEYVYNDGTKVKWGAPVGIEVYNPRTNQVEFHMFNDILYSNEGED